jgi:hypothetical protein
VHGLTVIYMAEQPARRQYVTALTSYDMRRDPVDHVLERVLPAELGTVHAVTLWRYRRPKGQPQFLDRWHDERALCGRRVKVLLSLPFRPADDDEDQCEKCRRLVRAGASSAARRLDEDFDPTDSTGVPPTSGHPWTGRKWSFGQQDEAG